MAIARKKIGTSWQPFVRSAAEHARAFEDLVAEALDALPDNFSRALSNIEVVIEEEPDEPGLLGLYQGVPLTERDAGYTGMLPDRISIYRGPIERHARSDADLKDIVRDTVLHELAHHFGIDDDRLRELGHD